MFSFNIALSLCSGPVAIFSYAFLLNKDNIYFKKRTGFYRVFLHKFTHTTAFGTFVDTVVGEVLSLKFVLRKHNKVSTESTVRLNANTALSRERAVFIVALVPGAH